MKEVFTAKHLQAFLASGKSEADLPANAILTPSARDLLRTQARQSGRPSPASAAPPRMAKEPVVPDYEYNWKPGQDPQTPQEIQRFFNSPEIHVLKERIVDMGKRIWAKNYVDGNGGNLTIRVGDNMVLCTPTLISKGFMTPDDLCLVDMDGNQLAGTRKRTSEVNTHIGIMKRQPKAKACVHAHPPHGTAFAIAGNAPPSCLIPEAEVFLGQIGVARYETPGSQANADAVGEVGRDHQAILMQNHGVITWGKDIEDAYWKMENLDAYCLTVWMASQIGNMQSIAPNKVKELIGIRESLGMDDVRSKWKECQLCDSSDFRPGAVCPPAPAVQNEGGLDSEAEDVVRQITDRILSELNG